MDTDESQELSKYLTFALGEACYGLDIHHVREIIGMQPITFVPDVPGHVRGVINLRGRVIPVMDVRQRLHLVERAYDDRTCIIVICLEDWLVGLVVDRVAEVLDIQPGEIEPPPGAFGVGAGSCIAGLSRQGEHVRLILDVQALLEPPARAA